MVSLKITAKIRPPNKSAYQTKKLLRLFQPYVYNQGLDQQNLSVVSDFLVIQLPFRNLTGVAMTKLSMIRLVSIICVGFSSAFGTPS